jgi:hypothetical protein
MSAATRLPAVAGALTVVGGSIAALSRPTVHSFLAKRFGARSGSLALKLLALVFALANLKNLPGFWHIRVLRGIIYQIYFNHKHPIPPKHIFAPIITQSRNTIWDCDYNIHKSNSTYFADLDIGRAHMMGAIIRTGLARLNAGDQEGLPQGTVEARGKYVVALGAVSCFFQRQIEPLQAFEVYTRVLSWDRKWLYTVSHIVQKGKIRPDSYVLQPWKSRKGSRQQQKKAAAATAQDEDLTKYIFATSLARYVFKKGRLTINPEIVLERSRLLPPRPAGVGFPPRAEAGDTPLDPTATPFNPAVPATKLGESAVLVGDELGNQLQDILSKTAADEDWTWDDMEKERLRGLELASHFDALNACHGELRAGDVLGKYNDYW